MIERLRVQILLSATWFLPSERRIKLVICVCAILAPDIKRVAEILKLTIQPGFNMDTRAYTHKVKVSIHFGELSLRSRVSENGPVHTVMVSSVLVYKKTCFTSQAPMTLSRLKNKTTTTQ